MNRYIEHIIKDLIRDSRINYETGSIYYPFKNFDTKYITYTSLPDRNLFYSFTFRKPPYYEQFSEYCMVRYGLTDKEISTVWEQYRLIMVDRIENR